MIVIDVALNLFTIKLNLVKHLNTIMMTISAIPYWAESTCRYSAGKYHILNDDPVYDSSVCGHYVDHAVPRAMITDDVISQRAI